MEFDYMKGYLLSDLIYSYIKTKNEKYYNEIKKRMLFCNFNINEINELIKFETNIIFKKKTNYDKRIMDNYMIIGKTSINNIFDNPDDYVYNPEKTSSKTLLLSETLAIIDEAFFLTGSTKIDGYKAKNEIYNLAIENSNNWLFYEFKNRIEYICRCANHIINGPKTALYNEKNNMLYDNEMQICMQRWKNFKISAREFIPYTEQYFIREE